MPSQNRYDDFEIGMGSLNALTKIKGSFSNDVDINGNSVGHDHSGPGLGGQILGSSISGSVNHSLSCNNALNLTSDATINNQPISSIFESNYLTVKNSSNCASTIGGKSLSSIFESDGLTIKNCTSSINSNKLNNLSSSYYQNFYDISSNILLEKNNQQSLSTSDSNSFIAAILTIYTPGIYTISSEIKVNHSAHTILIDYLWFNYLNLFTASTSSTTYIVESINTFIPAGKLYIKLTCNNADPRQFGSATAYIQNIKLKGQLSAVPQSTIT